MVIFSKIDDTYDHRLRRLGHPVRSAIHKPQIGRLVVGWVTTSESLLLYVLFFTFVILFSTIFKGGSLDMSCTQPARYLISLCTILSRVLE